MDAADNAAAGAQEHLTTTAAPSAMQSFDSTWSATDATSLLPNNVPLRRIPRAWDRAPSSPYARKHQVSRIWRRIQLPALGTTRDTIPEAEQDEAEDTVSRETELGARSGTIKSPKKVVKKLCLDTTFGRDSRTTVWERGRGTHMRKKVAQVLTLLPTPPLEEFESEEAFSPTATTPDLEVVLVVEENDSVLSVEEDDILSDKASDENGVENIPDLAARAALEDDSHVIEDTSLGDETLAMSPLTNPCRLLADQGSHAYDTHREETSPRDNSLTCEYEISSTDDRETDDTSDSPLQHPDDSDTVASAALHAASANGPSTLLSPIKRPQPAPLEDLAPQEARTKPRISDDTAILHAFLTRAAANKKPTTIAKRESLSNRRDSDVVRQALASPAKPEVLGDLDPNSPSPRKAALEADFDDAAFGAQPSDSQQTSIDGEQSVPNRVRRMRRSARSRPLSQSSLGLVVAESTPVAPTSGRNKITIRGPAEQIALKRTEAQELALATRTNTRKNKGGSVLPMLRLAKLGADATAIDLPTELLEEHDTKNAAKTVRWDQTLAYFQEHNSQPGLPELGGPTLASEPQMPTADTEVASPTKSKARRSRTPRQSSPSKALPEAPIAPELDAQTSAQPSTVDKLRTTPAKKRSRIATPAKGLLSAASLLPPGVLAADDAALVPPTSSTASGASTGTAKPPRTKKPITRSLPAPRKLNLTPAVQVPSDGKENRVQLGSSAVTTPKKSGIPSIRTFAPKLDFQQVGDFSEALSLLSSPAKKRKGGAVGRAIEGAESGLGASRAQAEDVLPSLASPAKKRVRARVL